MPKVQLNKILYVEDEEDIRAIAQVALEDMGNFTVLFCADGPEALQKIDSFNPDLILLDVMLPGMDGPTILMKIRAQVHLQHIPVIFMTAKIQSDELAEYKDMGVISVISKPFDPLDLANVIRQTWDKYHE